MIQTKQILFALVATILTNTARAFYGLDYYQNFYEHTQDDTSVMLLEYINNIGMRTCVEQEEIDIERDLEPTSAILNQVYNIEQKRLKVDVGTSTDTIDSLEIAQESERVWIAYLGQRAISKIEKAYKKEKELIHQKEAITNEEKRKTEKLLIYYSTLAPIFKLYKAWKEKAKSIRKRDTLRKEKEEVAIKAREREEQERLEAALALSREIYHHQILAMPEADPNCPIKPIWHLLEDMYDMKRLQATQLYEVSLHDKAVRARILSNILLEFAETMYLQGKNVWTTEFVLTSNGIIVPLNLEKYIGITVSSATTTANNTIKLYIEPIVTKVGNYKLMNDVHYATKIAELGQKTTLQIIGFNVPSAQIRKLLANGWFVIEKYRKKIAKHEINTQLIYKTLNGIEVKPKQSNPNSETVALPETCNIVCVNIYSYAAIRKLVEFVLLNGTTMILSNSYSSITMPDLATSKLTHKGRLAHFDKDTLQETLKRKVAEYEGEHPEQVLDTYEFTQYGEIVAKKRLLVEHFYMHPVVETIIYTQAFVNHHANMRVKVTQSKEVSRTDNFIRLLGPMSYANARNLTLRKGHTYAKLASQPMVKGNAKMKATKTFLISRYNFFINRHNPRAKILIKSMNDENAWEEKQYLVAMIDEFELAISRAMHEKLLELSRDYDVFCICFQHPEQRKRQINTNVVADGISDSEGEDEFETTCYDDLLQENQNLQSDISIKN